MAGQESARRRKGANGADLRRSRLWPSTAGPEPYRNTQTKTPGAAGWAAFVPEQEG